MRRKIWNLVCVLGFTALACGIYLFVGNDINRSFAIMAGETDSGGGKSKTTANTTSGCGSYYSYPPRCSEGYTTNKVAYSGKTCYTACTKKTNPINTSDFCVSGDAFASISEATQYCNFTGYQKADQTGKTTSGKICAKCSEKTESCESKFGEFSYSEDASKKCGGDNYVKAVKRSLNNKTRNCYVCKSASENSQKCLPDNIGYCLDADSCQNSGGMWVLGTCKARYSSYNEFCISKGGSYTKKTCPSNYESVAFGAGGYGYYWSCYSDCAPTKEYEEELKCQERNMSISKPTCSSGMDSYETYIGGGTNCYTSCMPTKAVVCEKNGLELFKPNCLEGEMSYAKFYDGQTCYTPCESTTERKYAECYLCNGKATWGIYESAPNCFPLHLSSSACQDLKTETPQEIAEKWKIYIYGGYYGGQPKVEAKDDDAFEENPVLSVTADMAGWSVLATLSPDFPTTNDGWVKIPYNLSSKELTLSLLESGTYYIYTKNADGQIDMVDIVDAVAPGNNTISSTGVIYSSFGTDGYKYSGNSIITENADGKMLDYSVVAPQSTKRTSGSFQMLSSNKKVYDVKLLGDSKTDKTLTIDSDTGLLLYTLSDSEKTSLGITTEKVYVVASKPEAKLSRNDDGTFVKNENGDVIAAGKNELGTIYKISPKNDISTMSEYIFYAINLSYIENADYSDPNTWNDLKLLSYDTTTTADTDFTFEIVRNGYNDIVKQLSSTKEEYKVMPLASSTDENLGTFYIDFASDVTQYEFSVNDDQIKLDPVLVYTNSTYVEGFGPRTVDLEYGLNVEYIKVESAKGSIRTYTLLITRIDSRSSDNTLKSLVARNVELTPTFTKYTNEYYGTVANNITKVEVSAEKSSNDATFVEGYGSRTVDLKVGENIILVKVKSETESERTYKITITREGTPEVTNIDKTKSANNSLKSLVLSSGNLMFDAEVLNYNLYVSNDITSILATAVAEDEKATVVVNGGTTLQIGANKIEIVVTAEDGETKTYAINVIRKEEGLVVSTDSTLSTLQIRGEKLNFSPVNYLYNVVVFPGTDELVFNLEASNEKAQIEVIGNQELSDFTTVKIKVTAEDGSYSIYDVNVKVDNVTVGEIVAFAVCAVLVVGLIVYGTVSRNKKQKELKLNEKEDLVK